MKYILTKTNLIFDWQENMGKLPYFPCQDYDLKDAVTACSIKSSSGKIEDLYKSNILDIPENYKYTKLIKIPFINNIVSFFEFETTRIRIFKQAPNDITPMHIDNDANNIVRLWVALNEDPYFKFYFGKEKEEIILKKGNILVFNPNYLHGAANLSENNFRYTLNICGIPNNWLKNLVNSKEIRFINV